MSSLSAQNQNNNTPQQLDREVEWRQQLANVEQITIEQQQTIAQLQNEVAYMRSSSFWKLRSRYLQVRSFRISVLLELARKAYGVFRRSGLKTTIQYFISYLTHGRDYFKHQAVGTVSEYDQWIKKNETEDQASVKQRCSQLNTAPLISIVTPVYNTPPSYLHQCIESVLQQSYQNWELILHDDGSSDQNTLDTLHSFQDKDSRIHISTSKKNQHISTALNNALNTATGVYVAFLDADDTLAEHALFHVAQAINNAPDAVLLYSDEDKINEDGQRCDPFFKPDWNPDLLYSMMYIGHLSVYKKSVVESVGALRIGYEGAQDYDLALRVTEQIKPEQIVHIPRILYHWRQHGNSTSKGLSNKSYANTAGLHALRDALQRTQTDAEAHFGDTPGRYYIDRHIIGEPLVSIIIPFRDQQLVLERCVNSIFEKTSYSNFELLLVNNQSVEQSTLEYIKKMQKHTKVRVLDYDHPFNFSAINNFASQQAKGEYLLFLNNDTEVLTKNWLTALLGLAQRPTTGAVGAKLLYPNNTIQHAGVVVGIQPIAGHAMKYFPVENEGYCSMLNVVRNYSAVTGACLMVKATLFHDIGEFNEKELAVAYNDVDLCLRLAQKGYWNVYTPAALLYHHESLSRGDDEKMKQEDPKVKKRLEGERAYMIKHWSVVMEHDPAYNKNLTRVREDFTLNLE